MMKKNLYFGIALSLAVAAISCSMDFEPTGAYSDKTFWYSAKNAESGLTGCFLPLRNGSLFGHMAIALEECATPNAYNYDNNSNWNDIAKGSHTAEGTVFAGRWKYAYTGIGRCNMLLANIDQSKELSSEEITQMKAQARFLRALYYSVLTTYYYSAPLITDAPDISQVNQPRAERATIIQFILDELEAVSKILPRNYTSSSDQGRPTAGAALALRARVLLFEASALCNPDHNEEAWRAAADAAYAMLCYFQHNSANVEYKVM